VNVTVSVSPVGAEVPEVTGLESAEALRVLTEALYAPVMVDIFGEAVVGTVLDQAPAAGTSWVTGRPVAIGVAAGPDDGTGTIVPNLKGDQLMTAKAKLEKAQLLSAGFLTQIATPETNVVVDQLPEGGTVVRPGTTVLLLLRAP
jgi:beta-lactam-binding protein with PASTA domain